MRNVNELQGKRSSQIDRFQNFPLFRCIGTIDEVRHLFRSCLWQFIRTFKSVTERWNWSRGAIRSIASTAGNWGEFRHTARLFSRLS